MSCKKISFKNLQIFYVSYGCHVTLIKKKAVLSLYLIHRVPILNYPVDITDEVNSGI